METLSKYYKQLTFGVIALIFAGYVYFVMIPQIKYIFTLKSEISASRTKYQLYLGYEKKLKDIDEDSKVIVKKLSDIRNTFPPNMSHSDIYVLYKLLSEYSGVSFKNLSISEAKEINTTEKNLNSPLVITDPQLIELAKEMGIETTNQPISTNTKNDSTKDSKVVSSSTNSDKAVRGPYNIMDGRGFVIEVAAESTGTDAQFKKLFSLINDIPSRINIKQINFVPKGELVNAAFVLQLFGIKDQATIFGGFFPKGSWEALPTGKDVVWSNSTSLQAAPVNRSEPNKEVAALGSYDFTMRVVPFGNNMAPSTVSISARNLTDSKASGLIYGDNKLEEKVEIYVSEKNGKLYCKYRTQTEAFPDKGFSKTAEFKQLSDSIVLGIDTVKRTYAADKSGVNIKIYNSTSKKFSVEVLNDDLNNSRVKVEKALGNINVIYK